MKLKRFICLFLVLIVCAAAIAGCTDGGTKDDPGTSDSASTDSAAVESTVPENQRDTLGDKKFDGTYRILTRTSTEYEFNSENTHGATNVNAAILSRNAAVEDRFGVKIEVEATPGDWGKRQDFLSKLETIMSSGNSEGYSLVAGHSAVICSATWAGYAADMSALPNVDFNKVWWSDDFYRNCSVDGHTYFMIGDIAYTLYEYMICTFFNQETVGNLSLESPYDLVEKNEWTLEKMIEMVKAVSTDLTVPENAQYGLLLNTHSVRGFTTAFELPIAEKLDNGRYTFPSGVNTKTEAAFSALIDMFGLDQVYFNSKNTGNDAVDSNAIFSANRGMFYIQTLSEAQVLSQTMKTYGVVPYPKYDKSQIDYCTPYRDTLTAVMVPKVMKDDEMIGTVTEALCMISRDTVAPAYYESALKYRYTSDPKVVKMLDLVRNDLAVTFEATCSIPNVYQALSTMYAKQLTYPVYYEKYVQTWNESLADIYANLDKLK